MPRDRDTYVHRLGVTPETASVISSKNKIYAIPADPSAAQAVQIGVVATFNPTETRAIEPVRGIGFGDHVAELVPGVTEHMTIAVTRTAQYLSMVWQVFGYKGGIDGIVRSLRHHKWPFDLTQELVVSQLQAVQNDLDSNGLSGLTSPGWNLDGLEAIMTFFEGCWMSDWSVSYASDAALVQEDVTINVTDIIAGGGVDYTESSTELFNDNAQSRITNPLGTDRRVGGIATGQPSGGLTIVTP